MKRLPIMFCLALFGIAQVAHDADALRFGPRIGFYAEKFRNACFQSKRFGLEELFTIETGPDMECHHGGHCAGAGRRPANMPNIIVIGGAYGGGGGGGNNNCQCNCRGNGSGNRDIYESNYAMSPGRPTVMPPPNHVNQTQHYYGYPMR